MSYALNSGNVVQADDSGVRITRSSGEVLATFDYADISRVYRNQQGDVAVQLQAGNEISFAANDVVSQELERIFEEHISQEAQGASGGFVQRLQDRAQTYAGQAQQRATDAKVQQAQQLGVSPAVADQVDFDNASQLQRIQGGLIPGEKLYAVYDMKGGGTGFVGITDRRLIIQDEGRVRKKRSLISIPYSRITMLASKDEGGMLRKTSELTVIAGSQEFEMEFRSSDKAERAYTFIIQHLT